MSQTRIGNRRSGWLKSGYFMGAVVLFAIIAQTSVATAQESGAGSVKPLGKSESYVWIQDPYTNESVLTTYSHPDTSLWNKARITDYEEAMQVETAPPLGILTIDKLNINVPIYNGTDDFTLDRGAGRIKGMAKMDEEGNLGISAHRDGYFRGLKDIKKGDEIQIQTTRGVEEYAVTEINIVPKTDASVLAPTSEKTLTLVTCYPFYFVGNAPKRMIVTAMPK